jgi:hypothetical protein
MAKENLTAIGILIDGSSSMESMKKGVISGFNEFLKTQKKVKGKATISMVQFSTGYYGATPNYVPRHKHKDYGHINYRTIYNFQDLNEAKALNDESYVPNGGTPLIDSAVRFIDEFGAQLASIPEQDRPSKVVLVVITDGEENSSTVHTKEELLAKITHQTSKYNWQVVYLGANQDSFAEAGQYGISMKSTANFQATDAGMMRAYAVSSNSLASYRSGKSLDVDLTDLQKDNSGPLPNPATIK